MKSIQIIDNPKKSQLKEIIKIYTDFFKEINFNDFYSETAIKCFAKKKIIDIKKNKQYSKYYFCLKEDKIIGFIHGKIIDNIGIICHSFIYPEYRDQFTSIYLYKNLTNWFKSQNIDIIETEISIYNPIINTMERSNWTLYKKFDDANIYQKRI